MYFIKQGAIKLSLLKKFNEQIYSYDFEVKIAGNVFLPARSTLIKTKNSGLIWYSPGPCDKNLKQQITDELGEVAMIIAPNLFHHIYLRAASELYPNARVMGPRGLDTKKKKNPIDKLEIYNDFVDLGLVDDFEGIVLTHHTYLRELVLLHKDSKSLILTDFCFNLQPGQLRTLSSKLVFFLAGTYSGLAQSRLIKKTCKHPKEFFADCQGVFRLAQRADNLIMAHGDIIQTNLKPQWEKLEKVVTKRFS